MVEYQIADIGTTEVLIQLWVDSFTQAYEGVHSPENIQSYCSFNFSPKSAKKVLTNDRMVCTIATRNNKPIGLSIVHHHNCPIRIQDSSSELKQLYILSSEYGSGLGKSLLEDSFNIVQKAGYNWAWLCVSNLNYRAQNFYGKIGFDSIGGGPILEVGTDRLKSTIMIKQF